MKLARLVAVSLAIVIAATGEPLRSPAVPASNFENPIDRFVDVYLRSKKLPFAAAVSDEVFMRRVYLDLWGLIPSASAA